MEEKPRREEDSGKKPSENRKFFQEVIKDERFPGIRKKVWMRIMVLGLVFGMAMSLGFVLFQPLVQRWFGEKGKEIKLSTEMEDGVVSDGEEVELDSESYLQMQESMTEMAEEMNRSMVEIELADKRKDWNALEEQIETKAGLIFAFNGKEYLIFAKSIGNVGDEVWLTFFDGARSKGKKRQEDRLLGMGIYTVEVAEIKSPTLKEMKIALLGSSNGVKLGQPIFVLGKPFGRENGLGFGTLIEKDGRRIGVDGAYRVLRTDIVGGHQGSGVIFNLKGEVIGILDAFEGEEETNLLMGYGISDLKRRLEILSNGRNLPYLGIVGMEVTEEIHEQGIPKGVYVKEVVPNSPAMEAGIQSGDILTKMKDKKIETLLVYQNDLLDQLVGSKFPLSGLRLGNEGYVEVEFQIEVGRKEE